MKHHLLYILIFSNLLLIASCTDECKNVKCFNGGVCDNGECDCESGYLGDDCSQFDLCMLNNVKCLNDGYCEGGVCNCPEGFIGSDCSIAYSGDVFIGRYTGGESCNGTSLDYDVEIKQGDVETELKICNLTGNGIEVVAQMTLNRYWLTIEPHDMGSWTDLRASISMNNDSRLVISYVYKVGTIVHSCRWEGEH